MTTLDFTHDPTRRSWVASAQAEGIDFPLQNLPFAVFRRAAHDEPWRGGVAIGDQVLDLAALAHSGQVTGEAAAALALAAQPTLNAFMAAGQESWRSLRHALSHLLADDAAGATQAALADCLVAQADVVYTLPTQVGDYTDFYTSLDHAGNIARIFDNPSFVTANFRWLPIAYHGRVSSLGVSGQTFHRPRGQVMPPGATEPVFQACANLDYELELAIYIGPGNAPGQSVPLAEAEQQVFGIGLLNDWSARDIQFWEMAPLGPFLAKNFATTVSPWIVTMDALAPFRAPWPRATDAPAPLAYLDDAQVRASGALDIQLTVALQSAQQRDAGLAATRLSQTNFRHQFWTVAQMVAHHTVGGCNLRPGDLLGSGTVSGPVLSEAGALLELAQAGRTPVALGNGETRGFLADGDTVVLQGWCERPGATRIGFGTCAGTVLPAI